MSATPIPFVVPQDPFLSNQDLQEESELSSTQSTINTKPHSYITATIRLLVVNDESPFWSSDNIDQSVTIRLSPEQARRIHDIHALSPSIEQAVASLNLNKDYHYTRYITFTQHDSYKGDTHLNTVAHAPSLKAWMNLLRDAKVGNKLPTNSPLQTLSAITVDNTGQDFGASGAVEKLSDFIEEMRASKVSLICFPKLTSIQALVAPKSEKLILSLSLLFRKSSLAQIKDFDVQLSRRCQPLRGKNNALYFGDNLIEKGYLGGIYSKGLQSDKSAQLTFWNAVVWGEHALETLKDTLFVQKNSLTSLTIDDVSSGKKIDYEITQSTRSQLRYAAGQTQPSFEFSTEVHSTPILVEDTNREAPSLYGVLQEYMPQMRLQQFQLNRFGVIGEMPSVDLDFAIYSINTGLLRNVNKISFILPQDFIKYRQHSIDPELAMNTEFYRQAHLNAIANGIMPAVKEIELLLPEKTGYEGLLTDLAEGKLPHVKKMTYLIPPQHIGEDTWNYEVRVGMLLSKIYSAIHEKKAPIETVLIEGFIPQSLQDLARSLEAMVG